MRASTGHGIAVHDVGTRCQSLVDADELLDGDGNCDGVTRQEIGSAIPLRGAGQERRTVTDGGWAIV
jgi:hypothetical protein